MRALALSTGLALVLGCSGIDQVDVTRTGTATIPGASGAPAIPAGAAAGLGVDIGRQALQDAGVSPNDVDSARVHALRLEVQAGSSFEAWLDGIAFYVEATGLPRALVAQQTGIRALPQGTTALDVPVTGVDLKPYVTAQDGRVTVEVSGTLPPVDTAVKGTVTVRVDVNVSHVLGL